MCPSGPLGLPDAGPGPGRCVKPSEPTPSHDGAWSATRGLAVGARPADAGAERDEGRSAGPAGSRAARGERSEPHLTATLLLEQGVELVVIKELLGHAHIGVTATVYAHVRLRLQRDAINTLSTALDGPANNESTRDDGNDPPLCGATVH